MEFSIKKILDKIFFEKDMERYKKWREKFSDDVIFVHYSKEEPRMSIKGDLWIKRSGI